MTILIGVYAAASVAAFLGFYFLFIFCNRSYKPPPLGWSKRPLTYWDCCEFGRQDSPTICWVLRGDVDIANVSAALQRAILRRAPWLRGRLARTKSGKPLFDIHAPPETSNGKSFTTSVKEVEGHLSSVVSYVPNGTVEPVIDMLDDFNKTILNPRNAVTGPEEYVDNDLSLIHLHFIKAADATLVSLCWCHAAMDAVACGQIVISWEEELNGIKTSTKYEDPDPEKLFDFTRDVSLTPGWTIPGWIRPSFLEKMRFGAFYAYEMYRLPQLHGSIYLPKSLISHWMKTAEKELPDGDWVSRNDLVSAWVFKYGWSIYPDNDLNTMFNSINFRGRHPKLPRTTITNTAMSYVVPPMTTHELRSMSLAEVARRIRKSTEPFSDSSHVAKVVTWEFNNVKKNNGKVYWYPLGSLQSRLYGAISWAKLGLRSLNFGDGVQTVATLTYVADRRCSCVIDSEDGDWRVDIKLSKKSWKALQLQMEKEKQLLKSLQS